MTLNEIQERNYAAQIKRGKITGETTVADCIDDLAGEVLELDEEVPGSIKFENEAADVLLNLFSVCKMSNILAERLLWLVEMKMMYNETRED